VSGLDPVDIDVVIGKDGTPYGSYADCTILETEFVDDFSHKFMNNAMTATRTIVSVNVEQQTWTGIYPIFVLYNGIIV